jgi:hypothetical protein
MIIIHIYVIPISEAYNFSRLIQLLSNSPKELSNPHTEEYILSAISHRRAPVATLRIAIIALLGFND